MMIEYGTTFIFLHEFFGIASYGVVFSLLSFNVINVDNIIQHINFLQDLELNRTLTNWALTVAIVKVLDIHGLVLLRWCLTIGLTPRMAKYIGPPLDRFVDYLKKKKQMFSRKKEPALSDAKSPTTIPLDDPQN